MQHKAFEHTEHLDEEKGFFLKPGTLVGGKYEVLRCLKLGAAGAVYLCRHKQIAEPLFAFKMLHPALDASRREEQELFLENEFATTQSAIHPHVVKAVELIRANGILGYTMEYVGGGDVATLLQEAPIIPIRKVVRILQQVCSAVQAIHDQGIIHGDLKPENVLLSRLGVVKITDFGIAHMKELPIFKTPTGLRGTMEYLSPEYLMHGTFDEGLDIYAIGLLGYEMLTGETPFRSENIIKTLHGRVHEDPTPPHEKNPYCMPLLSSIVLKALARDPKQRYKRAKDIEDDLKSLQQEVSILQHDSGMSLPAVRQGPEKRRA